MDLLNLNTTEPKDAFTESSDGIDYVLETLSEPLYDLPTHLYWESAYRAYVRACATLGCDLHPDVIEAQEKMSKGLKRLLKS